MARFLRRRPAFLAVAHVSLPVSHVSINQGGAFPALSGFILFSSPALSTSSTPALLAPAEPREGRAALRARLRRSHNALRRLSTTKAKSCVVVYTRRRCERDGVTFLACRQPLAWTLGSLFDALRVCV
ncbi:hypothetical protein MRX96_007100 [Rhipicephalus microplus]